MAWRAASGAVSAAASRRAIAVARSPRRQLSRPASRRRRAHRRRWRSRPPGGRAREARRGGAIAGEPQQIAEVRGDERIGRVVLREGLEVGDRGGLVAGCAGAERAHDAEAPAERRVFDARGELLERGARARRIDVRGGESVEHAPQPRALRQLAERRGRLGGAGVVALSEADARELDPEERQLRSGVLCAAARVAARAIRAGARVLDERARRVFVPRVIRAEARERAPEPRDGLLRHPAGGGLAERLPRARRAVGARRPDVRGEEERAALRLPGGAVTGELLELGREARAVAATLEDVDLERARRRGRGIAFGRARERLERARDVALARGVLGDPHGQRRRDAAVGLAHAAPLRELGRERGVARELRESEAGGERDALDGRRRVARPLAVRGRLVARCVLRRRVGEDGERAVEQLRGPAELARDAPCVGGAEEQVDDVLDAAAVSRDAARVARVGVVHRGEDHVRARLERLGERAAPRSRVVRARQPRIRHDDPLGRRGCLEARAPALVARADEDLERPVHVAAARGEPSDVDEQEPAPGRIVGELGAPGEGLLALGGVAELRRDHLEREPRGPEVGGDRPGLRGFARQTARAFEVVLDALDEERALRERARALFGRRRRRDEPFDELAEVGERAPSFEQPDEALERLAEAGVGVVRGQVVARGARLVAAALLDLGRFVEQARLARLVGGRRDLGAQAADRGRDGLDGLDRRRRELGRAAARERGRRACVRRVERRDRRGAVLPSLRGCVGRVVVRGGRVVAVHGGVAPSAEQRRRPRRIGGVAPSAEQRRRPRRTGGGVPRGRVAGGRSVIAVARVIVDERVVIDERVVVQLVGHERAVRACSERIAGGRDVADGRDVDRDVPGGGDIADGRDVDRDVPGGGDVDRDVPGGRGVAGGGDVGRDLVTVDRREIAVVDRHDPGARDLFPGRSDVVGPRRPVMVLGFLRVFRHFAGVEHTPHRPSGVRHSSPNAAFLRSRPRARSARAERGRGPQRRPFGRGARMHERAGDRPLARRVEDRVSARRSGASVSTRWPARARRKRMRAGVTAPRWTARIELREARSASR